MFKAPVFHSHEFAPFLCLNPDFPLYKNRQCAQYTHSAYILTEVPLKLSNINKTKLSSIFSLVIILFPDYVALFLMKAILLCVHI